MSDVKAKGAGKKGAALVLDLVVDDETKPRAPRLPSLVECIIAAAREPWSSLALGDVEIARVRAGGIVVVMGPTGAGKSSLCAALLVEHARNRGPAVYLSRELPKEEIAARMVGMQCDASWPDVLCGRVAPSIMAGALNLPRMIVLERRGATLAALKAAIVELRAEFPGQPVMAVVDYVQILDDASEKSDTRARIADTMQALDDLAREHGAVLLVVSQMSRAASRAARNGESTGADTTDAGAESAAIERAATLTLAIGSPGPEREDGTRTVDVSIGKGRMSGGDRVIPMEFTGRSGRWRVVGDARPAAEVRAERSKTVRDATRRTLAHDIAKALSNAAEPMSRRDLRAELGGKDELLRDVVASLVADPTSGVVEVHPKARGVYKLWTRSQAEKEGRRIVGSEEGSDAN